MINPVSLKLYRYYYTISHSATWTPCGYHDIHYSDELCQMITDLLEHALLPDPSLYDRLDEWELWELTDVVVRYIDQLDLNDLTKKADWSVLWESPAFESLIGRLVDKLDNIPFTTDPNDYPRLYDELRRLVHRPRYMYMVTRSQEEFDSYMHCDHAEYYTSPYDMIVSEQSGALMLYSAPSLAADTYDNFRKQGQDVHVIEFARGWYAYPSREVPSAEIHDWEKYIRRNFYTATL